MPALKARLRFGGNDNVYVALDEFSCDCAELTVVFTFYKAVLQFDRLPVDIAQPGYVGPLGTS